MTDPLAASATAQVMIGTKFSSDRVKFSKRSAKQRTCKSASAMMLDVDVVKHAAMAVRKPVQLKLSSATVVRTTPKTMGMRAQYTRLSNLRPQTTRCKITARRRKTAHAKFVRTTPRSREGESSRPDCWIWGCRRLVARSLQ
jgi:hypothetical protein